MAAPEVLEQLLVCRGLLQRVELAPVQVLQEGVPQEGVVLRVPDDRRDRGETRELRCPPTTFAHHQLIASRAVSLVSVLSAFGALGAIRSFDPADDDRLEDPDLGDGVGQLA